MGGKVFRTIANELFYDADIENNPRPFGEWFRNFSSDYSNEYNASYILATPFLSVRKKEAEDMKRFVEEGNTLLLITDGFSEAFSDVFHIKCTAGNDAQVATNLFGLTDTHRILRDSLDLKYGYFFTPFVRSVDPLIQHSIDTLGFNMVAKPDAVLLSMGSGRLFIITNAAAFSNYFLLSGQNYRFAVNVLENLNQGSGYVFWDEFYRKNINRSNEEKSLFDAILSVPALRWAFWLLLFLCALAVITNMFRKQRIVPVKVPNRNTTVEFTQTIARLYFSNKDNNNIAQKMIQHFLEHIRTNFYVPHQKLDDGFAAILAGKTNQPLPRTERLVRRMAAIMNGANVSDDMLLELNRELTELQKPTVAA